MIDQVTVFLENTEGRLFSLCQSLADAGVNMSALTIAETEEFGLVRIICDDPAGAKKALDEAGYRSSLNKVAAIEVPNGPGGLLSLLEVLNDLGLNIAYGYCFSTKGDRAVDILKITGHAKTAEATFALEKAGFKVLTAEDLK